MLFYGSRLSDNIYRREPEGYLICVNTPVARSGTQEYLPEELGRPPGPDPLTVYRPEDEVFSEATIASFQGMPVTNDHPNTEDGVTVDNVRYLQKGDVHNVRRGAGDESDLMLADLIIKDQRLIDEILGGKREISCGYTYDLVEEDGRLVQRNIRGNHVAVVDAGRAGHRVRIKDQKPVIKERSKKMKKISRLLARMAKDGDIEEVAEMIEELIEPEAVEIPTPMVTAPLQPVVAYPAPAPEVAEAVAPEQEENTQDDDPLLKIMEMLQEIMNRLPPAADCGGNPDCNKDEEPVEEVEEVVEEILEAVGLAEETPADPEDVAEAVVASLEPESSVLEPEVEDEDPEEDPEAVRAATADALRSALKAFQPAISKMTRKQKDTFYKSLRSRCADRAARVRRSQVADTSGVYAALSRLPSPVKGEDPKEIGKRIMENRNPNYKH